MLYNKHDIQRTVKTLGFLPFFKGEVEGFSIEEQITPDYWFRDEEGGYGVWDWKNDIIVDGDCAYGKLYRNKACFVSMEWYPDLANWRRSQHQPSADEQLILNTIQEHGSLLSREVKKLCGYNAARRRLSSNPLERLAAKELPKPKAERKGFDSAITRLQMSCRLLTADFEYNLDRQGNRYGWSIARYCTPEDYFGTARMMTGRTPEESRQRLTAHLTAVLPQASPKQIARIIDQ
ncbi:MAG: hypothetical protein IKM79_01680 [Bacteroidales bacterium]|nr:hypothetical protein [Bacteroidales bacterium]